MRWLLGRLWSNHSRTIVGCLSGVSIITFAAWYWPDGGVIFDAFITVGGVLVAFGFEGVFNYFLRETNKPDD